MRHLIVLLALCFLSCKDADYAPTLQHEIAGQWVRTDNPRRHYIFGDGFATTWEYNFSTVVNAQWFEAVEVGDRALQLTEINKPHLVFVWRFSDVTGDTVTVTDLSGALDFNFKLRRE